MIPLALIAAIAIYVVLIEPARLRIRRETIANGTITKPVRILLVSDFHFAWHSFPYAVNRKLRAIEIEIRRNRPDAVALPGDFLDSNSRYAPQLEKALQRMASWKIPMFATLGNHDFFGKVDPDELREVLLRHGVLLLENKGAILETGEQRVAIIGLRDIEEWESYVPEGKAPYASPRYKKALPRLGWLQELDGFHPELPRVVLAHNPDSIYLPAKRAADAMLCGHTHGGQAKVLEYISQVTPAHPHGSFGHWAGRKTMGATELIVSRGFGCSALPIRFLAPPEVVAVTLEPAQ